MTKRFSAGLLMAGILAVPVAAQMPEGYLDVYVAKVKMGKRGDFDAVNKRVAAINRKNDGDTWLAHQLIYGEPNTVYFTSMRANFGAVDQGIKAFEGALTKALGAAGMAKLFVDFDASVDSQRGELRRRRLDLSASVPADAAAYNKLVGQSRFLRTAVVRVRPGRILDYEAQLTQQRRSGTGQSRHLFPG